MRMLIAILVFWSIFFLAGAQGFTFGAKGGLITTTQVWNPGGDRSALFRWHAYAFIETLDEADTYALFAQLGYNIKGSAIRFTTFRQGSTGFEPFGQAIETYEFNNLSLMLGGKQKFGRANGTKFFYSLGLRGEYNLSNNLEGLPPPPPPISCLPFGSLSIFEEFVNDFTFGATVGAGIEFPFSELVGGILELTVNSDFTKQYNQQGDLQFANCFSPGSDVVVRVRQITNVSFELTLGIRLLRKVVYVD
jgi:hypothetical protein